MKCFTLESWLFVGSNEPVRNECEVIYMKCFTYITSHCDIFETFHIYHHATIHPKSAIAEISEIQGSGNLDQCYGHRRSTQQTFHLNWSSCTDHL